LAGFLAVVGALTLVAGLATSARQSAPASPAGQSASSSGGWSFIGGDAGNQRYTRLNQITAQNFSTLEVAWEWSGASFGDVLARPIPIYVDGMLITVAGDRRYVVAIDAATGETLWTFREPPTFRWEYSMRKNHGKGVAYANINGRHVVYVVTPAFFLHALDARTGQPLEGFGGAVPLEGFPKTGSIDLLKDLGHQFDPDKGVPLEKGYITSSSPPIVVNNVIIVGNSAEQGYNQSRHENIPGDILAYDARTGKFLWKFNVLPRPGEFGHETWENDAWKTTGDISSWAPLAADAERGIVYVPTNGATMDFWGGFRPGHNLFSTSLIALDVKTGKRVWHYQLVHHDIWNYDTSTGPVLFDATVNGQRVPVVAQVTKQAWVYAFNRATGRPLWPIEEKPVPQSKMPGEQLAKTQPHPTRPAAYDMQGLSENDLIDFTPALRAEALKVLAKFEYGPMFFPPLHRDNNLGKVASVWCPGDVGGTNIDGTPAVDPEAGILYVPSQKGCSSRLMIPGAERDKQVQLPTGTTIAKYAAAGSAGGLSVQGLPIYKPPYSKITAIDMNTGEHLWWIPIGETPARIQNHAALKGVELPNTGTGRQAPIIVTPTMLMYSGETSDGTTHVFAVDKKTGRQIGRVKVPRPVRYGMMTYMHDGRQYLVVQMNGGIAALRLKR
jgi:quinoprotein glucose dehydrogenase